ncbi:hypothetical protein L596_022216 [Steinernema carpocapsae]|uniref:Uncharacterized protein n=1 Tax=Steinernema carpocapsae TaxID=34508 RepID=A0A4U5ML32_STECR|nr:hypothetical protein L596_022216 [Steinernema carpocapsae]
MIVFSGLAAVVLFFLIIFPHVVNNITERNEDLAGVRMLLMLASAVVFLCIFINCWILKTVKNCQIWMMGEIMTVPDVIYVNKDDNTEN